MIGTHIGNYRIVTEIGSGAMGNVYFAEHTIMGRRAAVKVIRAELSADTSMVERFMNEARAVNAVGHPNIVEITDCGRIEGLYYIMMELLDGETLEERLERTVALDEATAITIALQVADALAIAHGLGIVHRDLKPENIYLISRPGQPNFVKLLDFGIAKLMHMPEGKGKTKVGTIMGTPQYMSPEQCLGNAELDHRSDIYSLGCVLYRMLTGGLPFEADTLTRYLIAHVHEAPRPPRDVLPSVTEHMQAVILRTLAKDPGERFADMTAFAAALRAPPVVTAAPAMAPAAVASPASTTRATIKALAPPPSPAPLAGWADGKAVHARAAKPTVDPPQNPVDGSADRAQPQRVANRLARILVERIHTGRLKLPSMPGAALACLERLQDPNYSASHLAEALGADPILAPQVLRSANSALAGGGARVRTLEHAVARLGVRELRSILLDLSARQLFQSRNPQIRGMFDKLWDHSLAVAQLSRTIARHVGAPEVEAAYLSGLLHDVGKPVAAALLLEAERLGSDSADRWLGSEGWHDVVLDCHREVGTALARAWHLPDDVLTCIARSDRYSAEGRRAPLNMVCLANAMVKQAGIYTGPVDADELSTLVAEGMSVLGLDREAIAAFDRSITMQTAVGKTFSASA
jgi:putative nucleotidyltransferase with HDIG domain